MIAGYAEAGRTFEEPKYLKAAEKAATFVLKHQLTKEVRLLRTYGAAPGQKPKAAVNGYIEEGTTTTPFDLLAMNGVDRFQLAIDALSRADIAVSESIRGMSGAFAVRSIPGAADAIAASTSPRSSGSPRRYSPRDDSVPIVLIECHVLIVCHVYHVCHVK